MLGTEFKPTDTERGNRREQAGIGNLWFIDWDAMKEAELYAAVNRKARNANSDHPKRIEQSKRTFENLAEWFDADLNRILSIVKTIPVNSKGFFKRQ